MYYRSPDQKYCVLLVLSAMAWTWMSFPATIDSWYTHFLFGYIGAGLRWAFGWIPFSVGDVLYIAAGFWLLVVGLPAVVKLPAAADWRKVGRLLFFFCSIWLAFHVLWGFNYYRQSIPDQFGLRKGEVTAEEIRAFAEYSLTEANRWVPATGSNGIQVEQIKKAYDSLATHFSFLTYRPVSYKPSLFGVLGNYMGYGGYYNPFTGEAQINAHLPEFMHPYIALHEVAHQLGYAKESDANFIGYLAALHSIDSSTRYSAHLELFLYANNVLWRTDSIAAKNNNERLSPRIKKDLAAYKVFAEKYFGPLDRFITWFYAGFLRFNNQPDGMRSYNRGMLYALRYHQPATADKHTTYNIQLFNSPHF